MKEWISGRNPVFEVLGANRRKAHRLRLADGVQEKGRLEEILTICRQRKLPVERVPRHQLDSLQSNHQGVALEAGEYPYVTLPDLLEAAQRKGEAPFLLVLDALQDPQNFGTLLRTAETVGVHGVLLPFRRTATVTPAVVHASSGACEHLLIAQVNLAQALKTLKDAGVWVMGLEATPEAQTIDQVNLDGPLALVVGSEAEGMHSLVRSTCDLLLQLPMKGQVGSLNAAVAGSIALFFAWQRRGYS